MMTDDFEHKRRIAQLSPQQYGELVARTYAIPAPPRSLRIVTGPRTPVERLRALLGKPGYPVPKE